MSQLLNLEVPQFAMLLGMVVVVCSLIAKVSTSFFNNWRRVRQSEIEAALKEQMLDRGMSATEIEQIMACHPMNESRFNRSESEPRHSTRTV